MNRFSYVCWLVVSSLFVASDAGAQDAPIVAELKAEKLGETRNVHSFGKTLLCGQPTAQEFAEAKRRGIRVVITLREEGEVDWDEEQTVKALGLEFHHLGFRSPESFTSEILEQSLRLLADSDREPVMLHCASANRVGAVWLAHRVLNDGISVDEAREEAKTVGLRTNEYEEKSLRYIRAKQTKK